MVLLILAGVTLSLVLSEGGIVDMAKEAANRTNSAIANDQGDIANLAGDIQNFVGDGGSTGGSETVSREGINIGDYIDYKPESKEEPTYTNLGEQYTGYTGDSQPKSITRDPNMKWQILKIYETGEMDIIGTPTSQAVYFQGATGYNNGVYIMNDICETLYSRKDDDIYARSVNSEDFERAEIKGEDGKTAREKYISDAVGNLSASSIIQSVNKDKNTVTWTKGYSYYPNLYANEIGAGIDEEPQTTGLKETDSSTLDTTTGTSARKQAISNLTTTYTYYNFPINEDNYGEASKVLSNSSYYWIASRCVYCLSDNAAFGLRYARASINGYNMFYSSDYSPTNNNGLRPVVHLGSNVQIETNETATDSETPHKITKYK